jgi:hypothetical protein
VLFSGKGGRDRLDVELYELDVDAPALTPRPIEAVAADKHGGSWASDPDVARGGTLLTFISDRAEPFQYDVYVMSREDKTPLPLQVTTVAHYNRNPRFAADDRSVWFLAGAGQNRGSRPIFSLWRVTLADRKLERIAGSTLFTNPRRWAPIESSWKRHMRA